MIDFGTDEEFIKNYQKLKSSRKMGELYGCSKGAITKHAQKIGYDYSKNQECKIINYPIEEIVKAYLELGSTKKVGERYGCSGTAVAKYLNKNNISLNATNNKLKYIDNDTFIEIYNSLKSAQAVADYFNCSATAVTNHAHSIGYNHLDSKNYKLSEEDKQEIVNSYENFTSNELAQKFNVSRGMITKLWYDNNKIGKEKVFTKTTEIDLTGQTFHKWTVLSKSDQRSANGNIRWLCRCECGVERLVDSAALRNGYSMSCGNHKNVSKGNAKIIELLLKAKIPFETEKTFPTCKDKKCLPFDFFINNSYLIEYDGSQHFDSLTKFDYEYTHRHDIIKSRWCQENGIPLIRIPYTHYDNLVLDDLILSTSNFIENYAD